MGSVPPSHRPQPRSYHVSLLPPEILSSLPCLSCVSAAGLSQGPFFILSFPFTSAGAPAPSRLPLTPPLVPSFPLKQATHCLSILHALVSWTLCSAVPSPVSLSSECITCFVWLQKYLSPLPMPPHRVFLVGISSSLGLVLFVSVPGGNLRRV